TAARAAARRRRPRRDPAAARQAGVDAGAEPVERRRSADAAVDVGRGPGQRAGAVPRPRAAREAGAAREGVAAHARRVAGRATGDEDPDGPHPGRLDLRTLTAGVVTPSTSSASRERTRARRTSPN